MPSAPADAPYLAFTNSPEWTSSGVEPPLLNLAKLAAGVPYHIWQQRKGRLGTLDKSALRVHRWHSASRELANRWISVASRNHPLTPKKKEMSLWLVRKHAVLSHALSVGEILPIDVLDAVVRGSWCCDLPPSPLH